jgi:hypothetical protein
MTNNMDIPQYSKVRFLTDGFAESDDVAPGTEGYVIEVHHDESGPAYEVEVMNDDGSTRALVIARRSELELVE